MLRLPIRYITGADFDVLTTREDKIYLVDRGIQYDIWFRNTFLSSSGRSSVGIKNISLDGRSLNIIYDDNTEDVLYIPDRIPVPGFSNNILQFGEDISIDLSTITTPIALGIDDLDGVPTVGILIELIDEYLRNPLENITHDVEPSGAIIDLNIEDGIEQMNNISEDFS